MNKTLKINIYGLIGTLIYLTTFFNPTTFNYNNLKYLLIVIIGYLLLKKCKKRILRKNIVINSMVCIFLIISLIISYYSRGLMLRNSFLASIVFAVVFIELVIYLEIMAEKNLIDVCLKCWYRCAIVVTLITDVLAILMGANSGLYFIGTKFIVVYQHLFLLMLFMSVNADKLKKRNSLSNYTVKVKFLIIFILTIIMSVYVDCATGLTGTVLFFGISLLTLKFQKVFSNPIFFVLLVILSYVAMWNINTILLNKNISDIITIFLNRELTLTGRTVIYAGIPKLMKNHWLSGFGDGSAYEICKRYLGYADTQNALMEWLLQIGILGTSILFIILSYCMKKYYKLILKSKNNLKEYSWILSFIYVYIILGIIEITYDMQFIGMILILYSISIGKNKGNEVHNNINNQKIKEN